MMRNFYSLHLPATYHKLKMRMQYQLLTISLHNNVTEKKKVLQTLGIIKNACHLLGILMNDVAVRVLQRQSISSDLN